MTALHMPTTRPLASPNEGQPVSTVRFDGIMALLSSVFAIGLFLDGWAHNNISGLIETFFTPYHAALYGGYFLVALLLTATLARNLARGQSWPTALPVGYAPAFFGVALFAVGGVGDLLWHETFGFEDDIEALLSPTHLLLAAGAFLYVSAPLRAAWQRQGDDRPTWRTFWPVLVSMTIILSLFTFFTQYATFARPGSLINAPAGESLIFFKSVHALFELLMPAMLVTGSILFLMRRWRLPFGSLTFLIGINYTLMFLMSWNDAIVAPYSLPITLLAGLGADLLYQWLQPSAIRDRALRWFAFLVPFGMIALYIITLLVTHGLWWQIHMWAGAPFLAGVAGLLLSFLAYPLPVHQAD